MESDEPERRLGKLLADEERLFILWMVRAGLCKTLDDLRKHFGDTPKLVADVAMLREEGFLEGDDEGLALTDLGVEAVAHLEDRPPQRPKGVDPDAGSEPYLSTGSATLDTMLGGSGLLQGSTMLLRGQPGAGKTTMALQIAQSAIRQGLAFVFVAVEEDPDESLNQITRSLWSQDLPSFLGGERWCTYDLTRFWNALDWAQAKLLQEELRRRIGFDQGRDTAEETGDDATQARRYVDAMRKERSISESLDTLWQVVQALPAFAQSPRTLVIIDSLSALINGAQLRFQSVDPRQMLIAVLRSFDAWRKRLKVLGKQLTVIFTAEDNVKVRSVAAESYIADVVVQLQHEPLSHMIPTSPDRSSFTEWKEDLKFCRVLKGRGLAIQRRPCCYEFVEHKGLTLFPTYAAQGLISLFHENPPQLEVIEHLRMVDIPSIYPGVVVQEFTRSAMQRIFAVKRYANKIPSPQPLLLSNVDEYWVKELSEADLLEPIPPRLLKLYSREDSETDQPQIIGELVEAKEKFYRGPGSSPDRPFLAVPHMVNVGMLVYRKDLVPTPPKTWEELEEIATELQRGGMPHPLLLESRTYDTFMTTALELAWSHGADIRTEMTKPVDSATAPRGPDEPRGHQLRIQFDRDDGFKRLVDALTRLHDWIHIRKIVPPHSSIDPGINKDPHWAFARHWYSTWVDYRRRKDKEGRRLIALPPGAEFGVAPIPISDEYRREQIAEARAGGIRHHSAWGEWYLTIQRGSENVELGIDLINNLMTSRKVSERAYSGASLPPLEPFYESNGSALCPETDLTFGEIRSKFLSNARSRAEIKNYRLLARVLSGVMQAVLTNPDLNLKVEGLLLKAFETIDPEFRPGAG